MIPYAHSRRFLGTCTVLAGLAGWAAAEPRVDAGARNAPINASFAPPSYQESIAYDLPTATVRAFLEDVYAEQNVQRRLPVAPPRTPPSASGSGIPRAFAWGFLGIAVVGITALALWLAGFGLDTVTATPGPSPGRPRVEQRREPERAVPSDWLRLADDLARRGRFGEAIHLLLLGVLQTLCADDPPSQAATAREIARTTVGPHRERLDALVRASEVVHFGGRPATRTQFEACRRTAAEVDRAIAPSHP